MPVSPLTVLVLALSLASPLDPVGSPIVDPRGDPAEEYDFIVGLFEKGLHQQVVREADRFLDAYPGDQRADRVRYQLAGSRFELGESRASGKAAKARDNTRKARDTYVSLAGKADFEFAAEARLRAGQCEMRLENAAAAAVHFESVRRGSASYLRWPATRLLGEALFDQGKFEGARACFHQVVAQEGQGLEDSQVLDAAHGLAWCEFRLGQYEACGRTATRTLQRYPEDPLADELRFLHAESSFESGDPATALKLYLEVGPGSFRESAIRGAAFAAADVGEHEQAAGHFAVLLAETPGTRYRQEALLHQGIQWLNAGQPQRALTSLKAASRTPEVAYWMSRALVEEGQSEAAISILEEARRNLDPRDPQQAELLEQCTLAQAELLNDLGRTEDAAGLYEKVGSDYALHAAAVARLNSGDAEEALRLASVVTTRGGPRASDAQLVVGEASFALGKFAPAEAAFERVVMSASPESQRARAASRIAWCQYLAGEPARAARSFERVRVQFSSAAEAQEACFMEARSEEEAGAPERASKAYRVFLERHPQAAQADEARLRLAELEPSEAGLLRLQQLTQDSPDPDIQRRAHRRLGERYSESGQLELACTHYEAVLAGGRDDTARYGLAWAAFSGGDFVRSVSALDPLLGREDLDPELALAARELAVWSNCRAGRLEAARASLGAFLQACADDPRRKRAAMLVINAFVEAKRGEEAVQVCDDLLREVKDREVAFDLCAERGHLSLELGKTDEAESVLRAALEHGPDHAGLLELAFFVGEARLREGQRDRGLELLELALKTSDSAVRARALYLRGFSQLEAGETGLARASFSEFVQHHSDSELHGEVLYLLGEALYREGKDREAIEVLTRHRAVASKHATAAKALYRLGLAQLRQGEHESALKTLTDLVTRYPEFSMLAEAELGRGTALLRLKRGRAARQSFERVLALDKGVLSARARLGLAEVHEAAGETDDALSQYLKVAVLYAHSAEVGEALFAAGSLLERSGDPEQARGRYEELVNEHPGHARVTEAKQRLEQLDQETSR